ncbi:hypothetical protein K3552_15720 [Leisingera aquaemixtae]|uniref:hypothetical protein n=1 Tax=Leisingera aquaemixtae TaxID=1396826 RepID=UPI0021A4EC4C|nr:hypothetical protein [Leisingera aquaemixtae]UWQ36903.1 hypothetical protein K3552_15720 [Leisingera aquaemixtae]
MTELIAMIAGPYLLITGAGILVSGSFYKRMISAQECADPILINLSGASHFVVGMTVAVNHFLWASPAEIVVSLVGVAAALKGTGLILIPDRMKKLSKMETRSLVATAAGFILVGTFLTYVGFILGWASRELSI